jgi:hypothetical protein
MFQINPRKAPYLLIPLLFVDPVWNSIESANSTIWSKVGQFVSFLQGNPLTSLLIIAVLALILTRR